MSRAPGLQVHSCVHVLVVHGRPQCGCHGIVVNINPLPTHRLVINPGHNPIISDELLSCSHTEREGVKERHKDLPAAADETMLQTQTTCG